MKKIVVYSQNMGEVLGYPGDEIPKYAYHFERQAGLVNLAQRDDRLVIESDNYQNWQLFSEWEFDWVLLNGRIRLYLPNVNLQALENLKVRDRLFEVKSVDASDLHTGGRKEQPVAAVISRSDVIYESPGFNRQEFFSTLYAPDITRQFRRDFSV